MIEGLDLQKVTAYFPKTLHRNSVMEVGGGLPLKYHEVFCWIQTTILLHALGV